MFAAKARQIVLAARSQGKPKLTDFRLEQTAIPTPGAGQALLQVQFLSLDPDMRGRMSRLRAGAGRDDFLNVCPGQTFALASNTLRGEPHGSEVHSR
jgi:NADPH-dependent curcumin reductase CurA